MSTIIATDGSCIGNPGPGAFSVVVQHQGRTMVRAMPFPATTVGEMEVRGLLEALMWANDSVLWSHGQVLIKCDAQYVVNGYNDWMAAWEAKGWHKKGGLAHAALWKEIAFYKARLGNNVRVEWVRAHQLGGCPLNARADDLANTCARSQIPVGEPALQSTRASTAERTNTPHQPVVVLCSAPTPRLRPSYEQLVEALRDARDEIDSLRTPDNSGAEKLSENLGNLIERAAA